ncbi:MAG TPA: hypothetical protein DCY13_10135 [Verrucomicrobiales bacterium]|nr:hypothetical protein [Verrucomicrobiales bacterium]
MKTSLAHPSRTVRGPAFSLVELLLVIAIIAVLAGLGLASLTRSSMKAQGIQCLNNLRQVMLGWQMYADDYRGELVPNWGNAQAGMDPGKPSWVAGWMDYTDSTHNTNISYLIHPGVGDRPYGALLGPYTRNHRVYRCPADHSMVEIGGRRLERVRSVSMNMYMNANWSGPLAQAGLNAGYTIFQRQSDFTVLAPARAWVLLDEHEDSINGPGFVVDVIRRGAAAQLMDVPASYHNNACGFAFADGHAEIKRWNDPRLVLPVTRRTILTRVQAPDSPDLLWLQERTTGKRR